MSEDLRGRIRDLETEIEQLQSRKDEIQEQKVALSEEEEKIDERLEEIASFLPATGKKTGGKTTAVTRAAAKTSPRTSTPGKKTGGGKGVSQTNGRRKGGRVAGTPVAALAPTVPATPAAAASTEEEEASSALTEINMNFLRAIPLPQEGSPGMPLQLIIKAAYQMKINVKDVGAEIIELLDEAVKRELVKRNDDKTYNLTAEGAKAA